MAKNTVLKVRKVDQKVAPGFEKLEAQCTPGFIWTFTAPSR